MKDIDFSELYSLHYKRLFHISLSITRDAYLAEDVVQETFIKAMKKAETIEDKQKVGAWLAVIAGRTALDFVRKEKRKPTIPMEQEMIECLGKKTMQNVEQEVQSGFMAEEINSAIRQLTRDYQDVLFLKLDKGLKEHEIASILNLKQSTVKTRIFRARKQLKMMVQMSA
ncbi:RNA polymerase sigma-70 factor (ECF subfamily) [Cytobacillus oceanisediminis]|uniref:RNA polymerase sigma factor n=1 Tax=Cytobacillus oceanisediminis TaxID=665099 RepID=A0A2V2ZV63_9BACI|nr:RNA polymerase sigma factor [Cytobacillus oceanisediminis]PWW28292.1 RNA polymerase sigma-70 factor (ECF subfamily) [Cytobacillus oceanisediminis]